MKIKILLESILAGGMALSLLPNTVLAEDRRLTPAEREALVNWTARTIAPTNDERENVGALLTPPVGSLSLDIRKAKRYLEEVLEKIAGPEIRGRGLNVIINIYANEVANAFAGHFSPEFGPEKAWAAKHPGEPWPIRRFLGFDKNNQPIYEVMITVGMLRTLKYEAELAWFIGHEVTHILEGHTPVWKTEAELEADPRSKRERMADHIKSWYHTEAEEVAADKGGTTRITGNFDLDGAIIGVRRLLETHRRIQNPEEAWKWAVSAALSTHHDQGLRLTLLHLYNEYLRRTNQHAEPLGLEPLQDFLKIQKPDRGFIHRYLDANEKERFTSVIDKYFLAGYDYLFLTLTLNESTRDGSKFDHLPDPLYDILMRGKSDPEIYRQMLLMALSHIDKSSVSGLQKVNAMLMTMALMTRFGLSHPRNSFGTAMELLTHDESARILQFFAKHSVDGKWTAESAFQTAKGLRKFKMGSNPYGLLENSFMDSVKGQEILSTLARSIPAWKEYFAHFSDLNRFGLPESPQGRDFVMTQLWQCTQLPHGPLYSEHFRQVTAKVSQLDAVTYTNLYSNGDFARFFENLQDLRKLAARELPGERSLDGIIDRFNHAVAQSHLDKILDSMAKSDNSLIPGDGITTRMRGLKALQLLISYGVVDARDSRVMTAYRSLLLAIAAENSYPFTALDPILFFDVHAPVMDMTAALIADPNIRKNEKMRALKTLAAWSGTSKDYLTSGYLRDAQMRTEIGKFLRSLSKEEMVQIMTVDLESIAKQFSSSEDYIASLTTAPSDQQQRLAVDASLALLGNSFGTFGLFSYTSSTDLFTQLNYQDVRKIVLEFSSRHARSIRTSHGQKNFAKYKRYFAYRYDIVDEIMKLIVDKRHQAANFGDWYDTYQRALDFAGPKYLLPSAHLRAAREYVAVSLTKLPLSSQAQWLRHADLRPLVSDDYLARTLADSVPSDRSRLASQIARIQKDYKLGEDHPDAYALFRNQITKRFQLQPGELDQLFNGEKKSDTETAQEFSAGIRGLSGLVVMTRPQNVEQQIQMIEYIAGRRAKVPAFFSEQERLMRADRNGMLPTLEHGAQVVRNEIYARTTLERTLVISSFLAGPHSFIEKPEGLKALMDHLLDSVEPKNRPFARKLAEGLMSAEHVNKSVVLGFILAQRPKMENTALNEGAVLHGFAQFYGVPFMKLLQYLGFAEEFKVYNDIFKVYQDEAMPISEYEAVRLLETQLADKWDPSRYQFVGLQGSGSVNIAIRYRDLQTGKIDVVTVLRENIERKTKEDFRRFEALIAAMMNDPESREKYEFILGLIGIIKRSVALEFDKAHSLRMQRLAETLYNQEVGGWKVRTVKAYEALEKGLFQSLAPGETARRLLESNPQVYRSAMGALVQVEDKMLRGMDAKQNPNPLPLFANPDLHDGQVLIDEQTKTVTIIDFGQALPLTNMDREFAIALLRVASKIDSLDKAGEILQDYASLMGQKNFVLNQDKLKKVLQRRDRMDIFVHLVSMLELSGFEVPLSAVHWVLGVNRAVILGDKVNVPIEGHYRGLMLAQKTGATLGTYNTYSPMWNLAAEWIYRITDTTKTVKNICQKALLVQAKQVGRPR